MRTMGLLAMEGVSSDVLEFDDEDSSQIAVMEEAVQTLQQELGPLFNTLSDNVERIAVLESIYYDYKENHITPEQTRYVTFALESVWDLRNPDKVFNSTTIATEHMGDRIIEAIVDIFKSVKLSLAKLADYLQYSFSLFSIQKKRISSIKRKLAECSTGTAHIKVGMNKYMAYGEHGTAIVNMKEYVAQYQKASEVLASVLGSAAELAEEDLFSGLEYMKEYIFGEPEDFFRDRFTSLENCLNDAKRGMSSMQVNQNPRYEEYVSPYMLGMSRAVVRFPKKSTYKISDYESMLSTHHYFYMCIDRKLKFKLGSIFSGSERFETTKRDVDQLLKASETLFLQAEKLLKLSVRFSNEGAVFDQNILAHRGAEQGFDLRGAVRGMRIYTRTCSIIYDTVSSGYNYGIGNVKQALTICEKTVAKL